MEGPTQRDRQDLEGGVPQPVLKILFRLATWRNILILWGILLLYNLFVLGPAYARIEAISGGVRALDFLIVYRPEKAYEMIAAYGELGRRYYATIAPTLDTVFPLLSAAAFVLTLTRVFPRAFTREGVLHRALFVPVGAMVADLLENAGIVTMLLVYPRDLRGVALLTSSLSTVKWTAVAAETVLVIIGVAAWAVRAVRGRIEDAPSDQNQRGLPGSRDT